MKITYEGLHTTIESGDLTVTFDFPSQVEKLHFIQGHHLEVTPPKVVETFNIHVLVKNKKTATLVWQKD